MKQQKQLAALLMLVAIGALVWTWSGRQMPQSGDRRLLSLDDDLQKIEIDPPPTLMRAQTTRYMWSGRDIFRFGHEVRSIRRTPPVPPTGSERPQLLSPPELPLKYFGYGTIPNGTARRGFLSDGDNVLIVSEGDIVLGRYRITKIGNSTLEFKDTSSGLQGRSLIVEGDGKGA